MPLDLPTAMLTVWRLNGRQRTWRVKLTPQTPFERDALRAALVSKFVDDPGVTPEDFDLEVTGTAGSPIFSLKEREEFFGEATEIT